MATIDKLLKFLQSTNTAELIDEEKHKQIATDVVEGYQIDDDSRQHWLMINKQALNLIKTTEKDEISNTQKDFPFKDSAKVVYPLIGPATIQLASRIVQHITRNDRVAECEVLGQDQPMINPKTGQPMGLGIKEALAKRITDFASYEHLIESDTWLPDMHKLCHILAAWGIAFKEKYYDPVTKSICAELVSPEDVIVNHNVACLEKARRITVRMYLTKNEIIEKIRAGQFLDQELDKLNTSIIDNISNENDTKDKQPVYEFLRQLCYIDLDEDDYAEPYYVYVHNQSKTLFGIYPAFEIEDIKINPKGQIMSINRRCGLIDFHLIDDPEGKFYSLGLNHLLFHTAKSITSILRMLIDSGTLKNAASSSGFVTRYVKTKERTIRPKLGEFVSVEIPADQKISDQFFPLPFQEPSQVLLQLLEVLIDNAKATGFMSDILTGSAEQQNVPATTTLAMVEQGTRAFKPIIQKLYASLKKEFKIWFHLNAKYLDKTKYFKFQDQNQQIVQNDFDEQNLDISPVADPTMSSEAHKYARLQAMINIWSTQAIGSCNLQEQLTQFYTELDFPNAQAMVAQPQPPPPNPMMLKVQLDAQLSQKDQQIQQMELQLKAQKLELEHMKMGLKAQETSNKTIESKAKVAKIVTDAHKDAITARNDTEHVHIEQQLADTEKRKVEIMARRPPQSPR